MPSKLKGHRKHTLGRWYQAYDPIQTIPGTGSLLDVCKINVPYAHRLIEAKICAESVEIDTTLGIIMQSVAPGAAKAGSGISGTTFTLSDDSGNNFVGQVGLIPADKTVRRVAGTSYHIELTGVDAADLFKGPLLMILVEPIDARTAL